MRLTATFGPPESPGAHHLSTAAWPAFALNDARFLRLGYRPIEPRLIASLGSTAYALGEYVFERYDSTDAPRVFNYNSCLDVHTSVGWAQGPSTPTTFIEHQSSCASTWFDALG